MTINVRFGESVSEALTPETVHNATNDHANRDFKLTLGMLSGTDTNESGFRFICLELSEPDTEIAIRRSRACLFTATSSMSARLNVMMRL